MRLIQSAKRLAFLIVTVFSVNAFAATDLSDAVINAKINSKIIAEKTLSVFKVDVSTNNGNVTFTGNVDSNSQANTLIQLAQSTDGVKSVNTTNLVVKPSTQPMTDTVITAKIKGMFLKAKLFDKKDLGPMAIGVETNNGIVYLSGAVNDKQQETNAVDIARSVDGVKGVQSSIEVATQGS